ncbi:prenyltransferase/squalene oxidase repeat-containing protein [Rosistilla ulvae]|uniref:prenyltransferase/squalene oxidase repeat-containing protein n=1 Tax=Rosistilla ulvae TaxID=1930277 RepID=UPI001FE6ACF4|nr:prenyltransferase/squalene oxidase repeat-containing protein [Rosistilla ulvae]
MPPSGGQRWRREAVDPTATTVPANNGKPRPAGVSALPAESEADEGTDFLEVEKSAPAWLISLVVHLVVLLLLALLTFPGTSGVGRLMIELGISEKEEEVDLAMFELDSSEAPEMLEATEMSELADVQVDDSFSPMEMSDLIVPVEMGSMQAEFKVSSALAGRSGGMKQALLATYGGTQATQDAVKLGLEWLKRNQQRGGFWSLSGRYSDGSSTENKPAATAMALLALQGDGNTHLSGEYKDQVAGGIKWLVGHQDREGSFVTKSQVPSHQALYAQGQCMIAICELYAMSKDSWLREPAQRAVNYAVEIQSKEGGWRYYPRRESDTSVTGWFLMGLKSAQMAGLEVPGSAFANIGYYLDTVAHYDGSAYSYQPNSAPSPAMTAEGLLCRQYLGWQEDHPALKEAVLTIDAKYPFVLDDRDFYYWYYATQVLHHYGGQPWRNWNGVMREALPKAQVQSGREAGSWAPQGSRWGSTGGRLYTTCLSLFCLEVYYRHMPLYKNEN